MEANGIELVGLGVCKRGFDKVGFMGNGYLDFGED
jgi:hypothetical protein